MSNAFKTYKPLQNHAAKSLHIITSLQNPVHTRKASRHNAGPGISTETFDLLPARARLVGSKDSAHWWLYFLILWELYSGSGRPLKRGSFLTQLAALFKGDLIERVYIPKASPKS